MGLDMSDGRAPYLQVADGLRSAIRSGKLRPGDRLPTLAQLADEYGVAKMTVQRALMSIRDEGLVVSWQGRGTFVRDREAEAPAGAQREITYDTIMRRLDDVCDGLQRLEARISKLEVEQARGQDQALPQSD